MVKHYSPLNCLFPIHSCGYVHTGLVFSLTLPNSTYTNHVPVHVHDIHWPNIMSMYMYIIQSSIIDRSCTCITHVHVQEDDVGNQHCITYTLAVVLEITNFVCIIKKESLGTRPTIVFISFYSDNSTKVTFQRKH